MDYEWLPPPFVIAVVGILFVLALRFFLFEVQSKRELDQLKFNEKIARLEFIVFLKLTGGFSESQKYILERKGWK